MDLDNPRLLHDLVEGLPDAFVLADPQGTIRWWNAASERLFGFTRAEALGASLDLIVPERFRRAHEAGFARAVDSGELRVGGRVLRTRATHKDGRKLYVDFTFALLKDEAGTVVGVSATARDATEAQLQAQGRGA